MAESFEDGVLVGAPVAEDWMQQVMEKHAQRMAQTLKDFEGNLWASVEFSRIIGQVQEDT